MRKTAIGGAIAVALALAPAAVFAQDDTSGGDSMAMSMVPHPSHIHDGLCPTPGDIIAPLSDVTVVGNDAQGPDSHIHVDIGRTTVDLSLDDILASDHSIVVHNSADDIGTFIACGDIGGHDVDGSFLVGIGPVGGSGFSGVAWITDNGDGSSDVSVTMTQTGVTGADAMPDADASTDAKGDASGAGDSDGMDDDG